ALPTELHQPSTAHHATKLLERETGIEPATNSLEGCDSTTELLPPDSVPSLRDSHLFPTQPSTPPAAPCWAKLFRPCGAGASASKIQRQIPRSPLQTPRSLLRSRPSHLHRRCRPQSSSRRSRSSRSCLRPHDQVRTANIASTAIAASLNFWSLMVVHASTASTANKANAAHNRFISTTPTPATVARRGPGKTWCTGEDSNLRSSQGAADLQSAAINHSATCAHSTERPAVIDFLRARRRRWPEIASLCCQRTSRAKRRSATPAKLRVSRAALLPRAFCDLGSCCWNQFSRRAARLVWLAPATPCGALTVTILELAKGFEPPTL